MKLTMQNRLRGKTDMAEKREYKEAVMEIVSLEMADILTASPLPDIGEGGYEGGELSLSL